MLVRCHNVRFLSMQFNPGKGLGRFHPFEDGFGKIVPVLYAAENLEGALSETIFNGLPFRGPGKRVWRPRLKPLIVSTLACNRDLKLAQLYGFGLRRLGVTRLRLIEVLKKQFPRTAAWAQAIHAADERIDGLVWVSRQNDGTRSLVLFGDRVSSSSLRAITSPLSLGDGSGYDAVLSAADQAGITIYD